MQPYYQNAHCTLYLGDCRDVLPLLADRSVGLVLTDPPYSETTHAGARTLKALDEQLVTFQSISAVDLSDILVDCGRVADRWVVAFADWRHVTHFEQCPPQGLNFVRFGIWVKPDGAPQFTGDRPATGWEAIVLMHRQGGRMRWNGGGNRAVWTFPVARNGLHPTGKPMGLIRELVTLFSAPGDLILDPFAGSGTTLVAAQVEGRKAIGVELDERYAEITARRLEHGDAAAAKPLQGVML